MAEKASVMIITAPCWKCGKDMLVAMNGQNSGPSSFSEAEKTLAEQHGVLLKYVDSKTAGETYLANICRGCGAFVGDWFLFADYWAEAMYGRYEYKEVSN